MFRKKEVVKRQKISSSKLVSAEGGGGGATPHKYARAYGHAVAGLLNALAAAMLKARSLNFKRVLDTSKSDFVAERKNRT